MLDSSHKLINDVLATWNPLDVPEFIATGEYAGYVGRFMNLPPNKEDIVGVLKHILVFDMGLSIDPFDEAVQKDLGEVADKIYSIISEA